MWIFICILSLISPVITEGGEVELYTSDSALDFTSANYKGLIVVNKQMEQNNARLGNNHNVTIFNFRAPKNIRILN